MYHRYVHCKTACVCPFVAQERLGHRRGMKRRKWVHAARYGDVCVQANPLRRRITQRL